MLYIAVHVRRRRSEITTGCLGRLQHALPRNGVGVAGGHCFTGESMKWRRDPLCELPGRRLRAIAGLDHLLGGGRRACRIHLPRAAATAECRRSTASKRVFSRASRLANFRVVWRDRVACTGGSFGPRDALGSAARGDRAVRRGHGSRRAGRRAARGKSGRRKPEQLHAWEMAGRTMSDFSWDEMYCPRSGSIVPCEREGCDVLQQRHASQAFCGAFSFRSA